MGKRTTLSSLTQPARITTYLYTTMKSIIVKTTPSMGLILMKLYLILNYVNTLILIKKSWSTMPLKPTGYTLADLTMKPLGKKWKRTG